MKHKKALLAVLGCVAALAVPAAVMAADDDAIVIGNTSVIDTVIRSIMEAMRGP